MTSGSQEKFRTNSEITEMMYPFGNNDDLSAASMYVNDLLSKCSLQPFGQDDEEKRDSDNNTYILNDDSQVRNLNPVITVQTTMSGQNDTDELRSFEAALKIPADNFVLSLELIAPGLRDSEFLGEWNLKEMIGDERKIWKMTDKQKKFLWSDLEFCLLVRFIGDPVNYPATGITRKNQVIARQEFKIERPSGNSDFPIHWCGSGAEEPCKAKPFQKAPASPYSVEVLRPKGDRDTEDEGDRDTEDATFDRPIKELFHVHLNKHMQTDIEKGRGTEGTFKVRLMQAPIMTDIAMIGIEALHAGQKPKDTDSKSFLNQTISFMKEEFKTTDALLTAYKQAFSGSSDQASDITERADLKSQFHDRVRNAMSKRLGINPTDNSKKR